MSSETFQPFVVAGVATYHGGTRDTRDIDCIVVHATEGHSADESISWLNRVVKAGESKASYHYLISSDHRIIRMLPVTYIAYHAGVSAIPPAVPHWPQSLNRRSIGIALDTLDNPEDPISQWQYDALFWLCKTFCEQYPIHPSMVFAHREVAPGRKFDPRVEILNIGEFRAKLSASVLSPTMPPNHT